MSYSPLVEHVDAHQPGLLSKEYMYSGNSSAKVKSL